ncbi:MAG: hypothetical protein H8D95_01700 [Candidatus Endolissoclinum sp.]|nr:hypothetical protein [Candidatus Endolissoclinum sp.]
MATLVSPGVAVTVSDESQYAAATQGTLPLLVIATASNKTDGSGSATATGTKPANAGVAYLVSSQRELVETFGEPKFYEVGGSVVQGSETSEYGLLAAYQYLGVSNNAYVIRADVDLSELEASTTEPAGVITNGTHWHDTSKTKFGLFTWSGTAWVSNALSVLDDAPGTENVEAISSGFAAPSNTFGSVGDFAVVTSTANVSYYEKVASAWILCGDTGSSDFQFSMFAPTLNSAGAALVSGDAYVRLATAGAGLDVSLSSYNSTSGLFTNIEAPIHTTDDLASVANNDLGDVYAKYNTAANGFGFWELRRHTGATSTIITSGAVPSTSSITADFTVEGTQFTPSGISLDALITSLQASAPLNTANVKIEKIGTDKVRFTKTDGKELNIVFTSGKAAVGFTADDNSKSVWEALSYQAKKTQITGTIASGTYWFNASLNIEIMKNVNNGGNMEWQKYAWSEDTNSLAPSECQLVSGAPTKRKDGTSALVTGDIWVDGDAVPYPTVYRWSGSAWVKLDTADQSSTAGLVFSHYSHDAPYDSAGAAASRTAHASAANPDLHPEGILMINMDYSTYNVKKYTSGKWEWASGVNTDGSGKFGGDAQRHMVVEAMQAAISSNDGIRSEAVYFNLISAPGYFELMDEMITLNKDKKEIAFVIGDCPMTLKSDSTSMKAWGTTNVPAETYAAIYYPHGYSSDLSGNNVVIPSSAIALRTIAFSDQVSYPWFAPAGLTRGVVSNASQVGYINSEDEFVKVQLSEGQRDVLYGQRINPIADFPATGMAVYGQKTTQATSTALDRVNVARLVNYMRHNLDQMSRAFLFEQNDKITRDNMRDAVERFCGNLVTQRGLYDFLVVCDESNNTPARIDRNELWVDVAIQPAKAVEFIYIPLRIRNTGETL